MILACERIAGVAADLAGSALNKFEKPIEFSAGKTKPKLLRLACVREYRQHSKQPTVL